MKSLDLSNFAHIKKVTPTSQTWDIRKENKLRKTKNSVKRVAIITPKPGKGFTFLGETFPKFNEVIEAITSKKDSKGRQLYTHYRQGGMLNKKGEENTVRPIV